MIEHPLSARLLDIPDSLVDGVRGLMLMRRNKDNVCDVSDGGTGNVQRRAVKMISHNKTEWMSMINGLYQMQQTTHPGFRIYASVNPRDMSKTIYEFKCRQLDADQYCIRDRNMFYMDIENRFFSCLMNPFVRASSQFLIDCDSDAEYENALQQLDKDLIIYDYPTKNGRHIITKPFNPTGKMVEIKKDALMFII